MLDSNLEWILRGLLLLEVGYSEHMFAGKASFSKMTGTTKVTNPGKASSFFRGIRPTPMSSLDAAARKMLETRRASDPTLHSDNDDSNNNNSEPLPEEAQGLKDLLLSSASLQRSRFSFSKLRRVVVPPVQIPPELAAPNAISNIVAGSKIPMTKAMWMRRRAHLMRRLPGRIDERVTW